MFAYSPLGSRLAVGAIEIVGAEPDGGGVDVGGGGGGGEGFLAATVAALPTMSATATIAAALTLRTRELVRLRIGRLPKRVFAHPMNATCAETARFQAAPSAAAGASSPRWWASACRIARRTLASVTN
jgi:hypothetical protein